MMTSDQVYEMALKLYLENNPKLQASLAALDPLVADALGMTAEQQHGQALAEAIGEDATGRNMHPWDFMLALVERNGFDIQHLRDQVTQETASTLGLDRLL